MTSGYHPYEEDSQGTQVAEADTLSYAFVKKTAILEQYRHEIQNALETDLNDPIKRNQKVWEFILRRFELKARIDSDTEQALSRLDGNKITNPTLQRIWGAEV